MLKIRKDNLQKITDRYFELINKHAVVRASNKKDYLKIESNKEGEVTISISRKMDSIIGEEYHKRTFYPNLTKEIWVYGLHDEDSFDVIGKSSKIKIRLIGGQNNDKYSVEKGKNIVIYDYKLKHNDLSETKKATKKLQNKYDLNVYDYKKIKTKSNTFLPLIGGNPDDGLKIGINHTFTVYGFERNPFTSQHKIKAAYYFATDGYDLSYRGEFARIIGNTNLVLQSMFTSPNFSINFYGYGNETQNTSDENGLDYNRVKVRKFNVSPSLIWRAYGGAKISLGFNYESIEVDETENRFVEDTDQLPSYIFEENRYAGVLSKFHFENHDNNAYPTIGMETAIEIGYKSNLNKADRDFVYLIPEISFAHKLSTSGKLVLATKFKGHINFSNNIEFYQAAAIGGFDGLRGFRNQRFTGRQSYYQNTDIRYSFNKMKTSLLPIRIGIYGSFDYGRVWIDEESSNKWHNSYGGGFFINGAELMSVNLGAFYSEDGVRVAFMLGFGF
jgi:hypothetical protein